MVQYLFRKLYISRNMFLVIWLEFIRFIFRARLCIVAENNAFYVIGLKRTVPVSAIRELLSIARNGYAKASVGRNPSTLISFDVEHNRKRKMKSQ